MVGKKSGRALLREEGTAHESVLFQAHIPPGDIELTLAQGYSEPTITWI
jgi:hypothetical protein